MNSNKSLAEGNWPRKESGRANNTASRSPERGRRRSNTPWSHRPGRAGFRPCPDESS